MSYEPSDAKELFLRAVELTHPRERSDFLDHRCHGNAELRARVDQLLLSHENPDRFLEQPALAELASTVNDDHPTGWCDDASRGASIHEPTSTANVPLDFLEPCSTRGRIGRLGVYEIIELVGRGGMGIVLRAYDTKLHRVVAIKTLAPTLALNATATTRFLREARATAAVSHDHVVTIFAVAILVIWAWLIPGFRVFVSKQAPTKFDQTGGHRAATDDSSPDDTAHTGPALAEVPFDEQQARGHQEAWAQHIVVPVDFEDPLGIHFRLIPPGTFLMGNPPEELNAQLRELEFNEAGEFDKFVAQSSVPQHLVRLNRPFYMAIHEVTVAQFRTFVDTTGFQSTLEAVASPPFTWKAMVPDTGRDQRPVVGVSWEDAQAFCRWLSKRHQLKYDLPSETQWEYACRAGGTGRWSFGDDTIDLSHYAACDQDPDSSPAPVGERKSNAFGLFDMHGNVDEWCLDWHKTDFYGRSSIDDPVCLESATDPSSGRVVRGGSWNRAAWRTRITSRSYDFAGLPVNRHGFRVAIVADLEAIALVKASAVK